jgi:hypothetical protein
MYYPPPLSKDHLGVSPPKPVFAEHSLCRRENEHPKDIILEVVL